MDPSSSDLEFFDFKNSSNEEIREIQALLRGRSRCVELPWEISVKSSYTSSLPESEDAASKTVPESTSKLYSDDATPNFAPAAVEAFVSLPTGAPYQSTPYFVSRTLPYMPPYTGHMGMPFFACPMPGEAYGPQFLPMDPSSKRDTGLYGQLDQPKRQSLNRRKKRLSEASPEEMYVPDVPLVSLPMHAYPPSPAMYYVPVFNHPYGGYPHMVLPVAPELQMPPTEANPPTANMGGPATAPIHGEPSPSERDDCPGHGESSPSERDDCPGHGESSPSASDDCPGRALQAPIHSEASPSARVDCPGHGESPPSAKENCPGRALQAPGHGECPLTCLNRVPCVTPHSTDKRGPVQADRPSMPTDNSCADKGGSGKVPMTLRVRPDPEKRHSPLCEWAPENGFQETEKCLEGKVVQTAPSPPFKTVPSEVPLVKTVPSKVETVPSKGPSKVETVPSKVSRVETAPPHVPLASKTLPVGAGVNKCHSRCWADLFRAPSREVNGYDDPPNKTLNKGNVANSQVPPPTNSLH